MWPWYWPFHYVLLDRFPSHTVIRSWLCDYTQPIVDHTSFVPGNTRKWTIYEILISSTIKVDGNLIVCIYCTSNKTHDEKYYNQFSQLSGRYVDVHLMWLHSLSKETHHEFLDFPCDPGSSSSHPGQVIFDHRNLKQVAKNPVQKCQMVLAISWKVQGYVIFWNS